MSRQQSEIFDSLKSVKETTSSQDQPLGNLAQGMFPADSPDTQWLIRAIWRAKTTRSSCLEAVDTLTEDDRDGVGHTNFQQDLPSSFDDDAIRDEFVTTSVLRQLRFEGAESRMEGIPKAHQSTFQWIYETPRINSDKTPLWNNFPEWLSGPSSDIYWITGKPGSGKSTLMKYVTRDARLLQHLDSWAADKPLLIATYYFWSAGTLIQKSYDGLLRDLLFQYLSKVPELLPKALARRWAFFKVFGRNAIGIAPEWTFEELLEAFASFESLVRDKFSLCVFIDGLDEFDGDYRLLLDFVRILQRSPRHKICVSSRPYNVFRDAFSGGPGLRLQDITQPDIDLVIHERLSSIEGFRELSEARLEEANRLQELIREKAEGVFLWVSVVLSELEECLTEGGKLSDLRATVDQLPSDISKLYDSLWAKVKPSFAIHASQLIQIFEIVRTSPFAAIYRSRNFAMLWLADEDNVLHLRWSQMKEQMKHTRKTMVRRLSSRTRGLLEISDDGNVSYLHRSVHDWIISIWPKLVGLTAGDFNPRIGILQALTVRMTDQKFRTAIACQLVFQRVLDEYMIFACDAADVMPQHADQTKRLYQEERVSMALDQLDRNLTEVAMLGTTGSDGPFIYLQAANGSGYSFPIVRYSTERGERGDRLRNSLPHWSSLARPPNRFRCGPKLALWTFVAYAGSCGIFSYVHKKATAMPNLLLSEEGSVPLVAAVCIRASTVDDNEYKNHTRRVTAQGLSLMRDLLEIATREDIFPVLCRKTCSARDLINWAWKENLTVDVNGIETPYGRAVAALLDEFRSTYERKDKWSLRNLVGKLKSKAKYEGID